MLRKLFQFLVRAVEVEMVESCFGKRLHIEIVTHMGGLSTDVYVGIFRYSLSEAPFRIDVYSEHLSYYAGRVLLKYGDVTDDYREDYHDTHVRTAILGPVVWSGVESERNPSYVEDLHVFGHRLAKRYS